MMVSEEDGDVLGDLVFDFFATGVGKLLVAGLRMRWSNLSGGSGAKVAVRLKCLCRDEGNSERAGRCAGHLRGETKVLHLV